MAQFTPPQFIPPQPSSSVGNGAEIPNITNAPGSVETRGEVAKSVAKSQVIRTQTKLIINSREDLAKYLAQNGLDLVTSWVEFEESKDFIQSSYVVYPQYENAIEKLTDFLKRYPQLQAPVMQLNQRIAASTSG